MPLFSKRSIEALSTCDPRLILIAFKAIEVVDFMVIEGGRQLATQVKYFKDGKSKTLKSKHVITDKEKFSRAMDILPYPFDFKDDWGKRERFAILAGVLIGIGHANGIRLRWGGDWDSDFNPENTKFYDGPHIELMD